MKKLIVFLLIFITSFSIAILNLGKFLDITTPASKTDLLVCLGGHGISRTKVALNLEKQGYLNTNTIILTGYEGTKTTKKNNIPDARVKLIKQNKYTHINFIHNEKLKNTAEEVIFIKKYMKKNNMKSVTFVTEAPHSRRVLLLANILETNNDNNFIYKVVEHKISYWNSTNYYKNKYSREYAYKEYLKIIYNLFAYGIFYNIGLLTFLEDNTSIEEVKPLFNSFVKKISLLDI